MPEVWTRRAVSDYPDFTFEVDRDETGYAVAACSICEAPVRRATEFGSAAAVVEHMNSKHRPVGGG